MARLNRELGRNRDIPQIESTRFLAATAGTGTDFENVIGMVPDLTVGAPTGVSFLGTSNNTMSIRNIGITWEANITGTATNFFTLNINQYRAGAAVVSTSSATTVTAGVNVVTPASMAGIYNGQALTFSGGTGATEIVYVYSVTSTTFTALFANGHSGGYTIVSSPLATISYASGTNATKWVPVTMTLTQKTNYVQKNDVITVARVSTGTGLASPNGVVQVDWIPGGPL